MLLFIIVIILSCFVFLYKYIRKIHGNVRYATGVTNDDDTFVTLLRKFFKNVLINFFSHMFKGKPFLTMEWIENAPLKESPPSIHRNETSCMIIRIRIYAFQSQTHAKTLSFNKIKINIIIINVLLLLHALTLKVTFHYITFLLQFATFIIFRAIIHLLVRFA